MAPQEPAQPRPDPQDPPPLDNQARGGERSSPWVEEPPFGEPLDVDQAFMDLALEQAERARDLDEVPIGAVIVQNGEVIGAGHNRVRTDRNPMRHAELEALRDAVARTGDTRLPGATVYTTVEPCFMCAGVLVHARVERVVWAIRDPKFGAGASLGQVLDHPRANHRCAWTEGVLAEEARELMQAFFRRLRGTR